MRLFNRLGLHPNYQHTLPKILGILETLAMLQLIAWLIPALPEFKGIPNYLPLHSLLETISIVVSMLVFAIGWNSRSSNLSGNIVLLACVFFSVGLLDFSHTISYVGMPDFISHNDLQKHLNFWLSARLMASAVLLVVAVRSWHPLAFRFTRYVIFGTLLTVTAGINWIVVYQQAWLPDTFVAGQGLTPFKKSVEYFIIAINVATALILWKKMREPQTFNVVLLFGAVCTLAMSELFFTLYTTMTGSYNVLGHLYKVIAYLFIYRAIVVETIEEPYNKLALTQQKLAISLKASNTGLWDWDLQTHAVYYSPEWKAQLGYLPEELPNQFSTWESLLHPEDVAAASSYVQHFLLADTPQYLNEFRMRHRDGSYRWILARGEKQYDEDGKLSHLVGSHIDITERKLDEQRIQQLANFDMLTGLPNRMLFSDRVDQAINVAKRNHTHLAFLFIDLDHFKGINDSLGHHIGDQVLIEMGRRFNATVREGDTVSRMGGDEFMLLLPDSEPHSVANIAQQLLAAIAEPYQIEQNEVIATASIGIAMYPEDAENFDTLYKHADTAMYRAKHDGRNSYCFFIPEMQSHTIRILKIEHALRHAIARGELHLHYQPQIAIADHRITGVEALLRWHHPELGNLSPAEFIPIAEQSGQIGKIGEWVLRTAVLQLKTWIARGFHPFIMAVNLSAVQFRQSDLQGLVASILAEAQLPPAYLELELTESIAMENPQRAITVMNALHTLGVRMAIDDFGTGYSSLSYLKKFKVYKLKIDQSFVRDIHTDADDKAIVVAIIQLSHSLGFQVIAEGVETAEQLAFLRESGCDEVQGYYFSQALPAEQIEVYLQKQDELTVNQYVDHGLHI